MWGEYESSKNSGEPHEPGFKQQRNLDKASENVESATPVVSLRDRIIQYMAASTIILKSQQRYEPDLTYQERKDIVEKLLDEKPGQFLYRFGKQLEREHLQYFLTYEGDPEVDYYLSEALKHKNEHTSKIIIRNRRFAALQKLRRTGDYFSEKEMERRNPLLYDHLIGKHQTQEEREDRYKMDSNDIRFSSILLAHIDNCTDKSIKLQQEDQEDEMFEEDDSDDDNVGEVDSEDDSGKKRLFKEEFYSAGYISFLKGNDEFDYGQIDTSDDYDPLDIRERDEEERYFDEDEEEDTLSDRGMHCNGSSGTNDDMQDPEETCIIQHKTSNKLNTCVEVPAKSEENITSEVDSETMEDNTDQCLMDTSDGNSCSKT